MNRLLAPLALLLMALSAPTLALGRISLEPALQLRAEYDDNVFLENRNEQDELISLVAPSLHLNIAVPELTADLNYALEFRFYANNTRSDETSLRDAQRLLANATLLPDRAFSIELHDEYSRIIFDERQPSSEANFTANRITRNLFIANPRLRLQPGSANEVVLGYRYRDIYYDDPRGTDSSNHRLQLDYTRRISTRLSLIAVAGQEFHRSADRFDYDRQDVSLGFAAQPSARLQLGAAAGYAWLDFRERDNSASVIWNSWGEYKWSERLGLRVDFVQNFLDSIEEGAYRSRELSAALSYASRMNWQLRLFTRENDYRQIARNDRANGLVLSAGTPLGKRLRADVHGFLTSYDFRPQQEDVLRYGAGASLAYALRLLTLRLGYRHERSDSDFDFNDYRNNVVFFEVIAALRKERP